MHTTVVIPTLTQPSDDLQQSLNRQRFKEYDIVVVKGVSPNGRARNKGVQDASGGILVFIDDDAVLAHEDVLKNMIVPILQGKADIVGASRRLPEDSGMFAKAVARQIPLVESPIVETLTNATPALIRTSWWRLLLKNPFRFIKGEHDQSIWSPITTTCVAMKKEVFDALGGFSEDLQWGVDTDFFYRAAQKGFRMALAPNTWVYHPYADTLTQLRKKYFKSGVGMAQEMKVHPERAIQPVLDSPFKVIYFILYRLIGAGFFLFIKPLRAIASIYAMVGYVAGWYDWHKKSFGLENIPYYLLLLATFFSPLTRLGAIEVGFTLKISEILLAFSLVLILWINRHRVSSFFIVSFRDPLFLIMLGYAMVAVASLSQALNVPRGILILLQTLLFMFGVVYLPRFIITTKESLYQVIRVFLWASVLLSMFAIAQFFLDYMGVDAGLRDIYLKGRFGYPRVHGTMLEPLYMAHYLLAGIGLVSAFCVWRNGDIRWKLGMCVIAVFTTVWALNLGFSRGGWIGLALVVGVTLLAGVMARAWRRLGLWLIAIILACIMIPVSVQVGKIYYEAFGQKTEALSQLQETASGGMVPTLEQKAQQELYARRVEESTAFKFVDDRIERFFDIAVGRREEAWALAVEYLGQSPILGIGIGNFGARQFDREEGLAGVNFVNNQPLEVLAETGLFGFLFYMLLNLLMVWYVVRLIIVAVKRQDTSLLGLGVGLLASFVAISGQFMTVSNWNVFHYWFIVGLIYWSFNIFDISERQGETV